MGSDLCTAGTTDSASKGFGLSLASIRPLQHSLYSYMHPLGLWLLPSTFDAATDLARQLAEKGPPIQAMIEIGCVSFFAQVNRSAHLTPVTPGMFRLSAGEDAAVESVHELDVREEDLLRYTNAADDIGYGLFLCDMAAAAGALWVFVVRDPYFQVLARLWCGVCRDKITRLFHRKRTRPTGNIAQSR